MDLYDLEARVFEKQRMMAVRKAVAALLPRRRVVIAARFGLDDGWVQSLDATAATLGKLEGHTLSRERIRQIEQTALRHLRYRGGLHDVADSKAARARRPKPFDPAEFRRHQQALQAMREEQRRADERIAARVAEWARRPAQPPQPQVVTPLPTPRDTWRGPPSYHYDSMQPWHWSHPPSVIVLPDTPPGTPSFHYDWMHTDPFFWMKR